RSGGVEHLHDTPPYPFTPSPTFAHSSASVSGDQYGRRAARHLLCCAGWRHIEGPGQHSDSEHFRSAPRISRPPYGRLMVPENRAHGSVGGLIAHRGGSPHARHETARLHHAARWRGSRVAARGARAAAERFPRGLPRTGIANRSDSSKPAPSIFARDARPRLSRGTAFHNGRP